MITKTFDITAYDITLFTWEGEKLGKAHSLYCELVEGFGWCCSPVFGLGVAADPVDLVVPEDVVSLTALGDFVEEFCAESEGGVWLCEI